MLGLHDRQPYRNDGLRWRVGCRRTPVAVQLAITRRGGASVSRRGRLRGTHEGDHTSGTPVTTLVRDAATYRLNPGRDRDRDGIACEKR